MERIEQALGPRRFRVYPGGFASIDITPSGVDKSTAMTDLLLSRTHAVYFGDEFFSTGLYRVRSRADTRETSSPSMDISKASNFERFVYDLAGRDGRVVSELWATLDRSGAFDLNGTPLMQALPQHGFVSGSSTHADRLATIRATHQRYGRLIDTHTADGLKVALEHRQAGVPMIVLETALPAKFEETIIEATGIRPPRPAGFENIESLPKRFEVMPVSPGKIKAYIAFQCANKWG